MESVVAFIFSRTYVILTRLGVQPQPQPQPLLRELIFSTRYVRDVGTKMEELDSTRLDVENHLKWVESSSLEIPFEVTGWLEEVRKVNAQVESIPNDVGGCFDLIDRIQVRKKAFNIIQDIDRLMKEKNEIDWTRHRIPFGNVDLAKASTTTPSSQHNYFKSRDPTFIEALKALEPAEDKSHMLALCGIGGVGKTTMMENLKKAVIEKKMFDFIIEATIGENTDPIIIQQAIAEFLGVELKDRVKEARAYKLRKSFEAKSNGGKKKFLVILDDVSQFVDLNDIGLSHLPNQGVDFKILMTSRNRNVCTMMGVEVNSILNVDAINDQEAQSFFHQFVNISNDVDVDLRMIGDDIASRCHGLPIAVKTIAHTLKGQSRKLVWEDTLSCLKHHDVDEVVHRIFETSYNNLQDEETRSTLFLCVLFPGNIDTPTEDMVRYGWGLKLFNNVHTIIEARKRLNACIERLIHANFLIESQDVGCVKMHNLVRAFVLRMCSKSGHASIVGNMSKWNAKDRSESCTRVSLTCTGMREFPKNHKYPNLLILKLMHGDKSLRFPKDFCEEMKKLEVISYDMMEGPLLTRSLQCSTNLRTLCLHRCLLMFDYSCIGYLSNLEVLSFAYCSIRKLPSTIGNLTELKLLDLTGCVDLCIDEGVLENLVKLEELYMKVAERRAIKFTNANSDELVKCSKNFIALEIEFFDNNALPKAMSFKELERFKISLGCYLKENEGHTRHSFENTLMLATNKHELLDSRMNELFEKTKVLLLQVNGINEIGDVVVESLHQPRSSFDNLRVLDIFECADLRYLFTIDVANGLTKLERLTISFCPLLETLVGGDGGGVGVITFETLKFLSLGRLPKLTSLSVNVIKLPQLEELILYCLPNFTSIYASHKSTSSKSKGSSPMQPLLNKKVVVSQLKILKIFYMNKLKEIWPSQLSNSELVRFSTLREIAIEGCDNLVNLFPSNPMALMHRVEELKIRNCGSVDVLFNIDLESSVGEIEGSCNLRYIQVIGLGNIREIWRVTGVNTSNCLIHGFQAVEKIEIRGCKSLKSIFTPATIIFERRAPMKVTRDGIDEMIT